MNTADKRTENKILKAEIAAMGYENIKDGHGTASGWMDVTATGVKPEDCFCVEVVRYTTKCSPCSTAWTEDYFAIAHAAQAVTGRTGEYHGNIQVMFTQV